MVRSNNDPKVPAQLFLDTVTELKGCPAIVRSDCGTENGIVAAMQCQFRSTSTDRFSGENSHIYGSSHSNQRIEGWWSFLRRHRTSWWMDFFKDMVESNIVNLGNDLHMECLWYCFAHLIQNDLDRVKDHWNSHYIRRSRYGTTAGVPDIMYHMPENFGKMDCLLGLNNQQIEEMKVHCEMEEPAENVYLEYFETMINDLGFTFPTNEEEALPLFQQLMSFQD